MQPSAPKGILLADSLRATALQPVFRPYLATLLLLCFMRTLLPEAWVLALHAHEHTTQEAAFTKGRPQPGKALLTSRHTHCQTEQFYNVPFAVAPGVAMPRPRVLLSYQPLAVPVTLACSATELRRTALRGPPLG